MPAPCMDATEKTSHIVYICPLTPTYGLFATSTYLCYCHPSPIRQRIIAYAATLHYTFVILSRRGARAEGVVRRLVLFRCELRILYVSSLAT
ncbi:uncharacterized protein SCHCODRAFT_01262380 [Schizophyllum commune H4-8]|uniref:uncharacterized protein n=1 Tax=Schizophyllum commune (strain H4-8 / FGSC 9210) TaxID=578458 RepID=UPI0021602E75|nr:uncharacterized protein SCHCODRAFT_01262380 [Schizophyllum commune H4-8]KAI5886580.1 hypothetical protein SCHCODRAFT_01262380 [Schizophyllum commune H4-8]